MISISKPYLGKEEIAAVAAVIDSAWLTQGPMVAKFEAEFAAYVGAGYACAVSSCTSALHMALRAIGVNAGDEIITVSHSFIATANSILYCNAVPVFVDVCHKTFNILPEQIENAITSKTKAILCVHQMGMPCDISRITAIAQHHRLRVIEDAACAVGSEIRTSSGMWERIGKPHGDIACFSFHPRKVITTGEGGMLTTNNEEYDRAFRLMRQHGMSVSDTARHSASEVIFEEYTDLGYNYRMTDMQAAVGIEQMRRLPELIVRRRELAARYQELLGDIPEVTPPYEPDWARSTFQSYCLRLATTVTRRKLMQDMLNQGVATRRGCMNAHREPTYRATGNASGDAVETSRYRVASCTELKQSNLAQDECILLPLYPQMSKPEQDKVVLTLRRAIKICE